MSDIYRVYFNGAVEGKAAKDVYCTGESLRWSIVKLEDGEPGECPGHIHHKVKCKHLYLRDFFEQHNRPVCYLKVSGANNIRILEGAYKDRD